MESLPSNFIHSQVPPVSGHQIIVATDVGAHNRLASMDNGFIRMRKVSDKKIFTGVEGRQYECITSMYFLDNKPKVRVDLIPLEEMDDSAPNKRIVVYAEPQLYFQMLQRDDERGEERWITELWDEGEGERKAIVVLNNRSPGQGKYKAEWDFNNFHGISGYAKNYENCRFQIVFDMEFIVEEGQAPRTSGPDTFTTRN